MDALHLVWLVAEEIFTKYLFEVASVVLFLHVTLTIHECAHAVVGVLLGLRSTGIRIGVEPLFTFSVLGYEIALGLWPSNGHTTFVDEGRFPDTWQVLVTYLAGPLSVVCAGPVFFMLSRHGHFPAAVSLGALCSFSGLYDLRKSCPDGVAIRRVWKVLRTRGTTENSMEA